VLAIYYGNRAAARLSLGAFEGALWDCDRALELRPAYSKVVARRATVLEKLGLIDEAMKDAQVVASEASSSGGAARSAAAQTVARLEAAIKDRDEKLKVCVVSFLRIDAGKGSSPSSPSFSSQNEMFDKLKGLGNSILGRFGFSLDNFKAVKDPSTGSYNISFQQ
jgi:hypothetical protein